jgi:hypothetical protein
MVIAVLFSGLIYSLIRQFLFIQTFEAAIGDSSRRLQLRSNTTPRSGNIAVLLFSEEVG